MKTIGAGLLCAFVAAGAAVSAQSRFTVVGGGEKVAAVSGLEIVVVRDTVLNACYTLFVLRPSPQAAPAAPSDAATIEQAAGERDRRLSALTAEFERGLPGGVPGTLGSNPLRYQWEGDKVQSEYERQVREKEFARLGEQLALIAGEPRLAVAGPAPCEPPPAKR